MYGRYNDRKKYSYEKEGEKKMLPNLFLSKNMIIFRGWELEMEELWRHWAMKFSFAPKVFIFFFSLQGFIMQNVSRSQTKADQRASRLRITITPTSVLACSSENSFRQVVHTSECIISEITLFSTHLPLSSQLFAAILPLSPFSLSC